MGGVTQIYLWSGYVQHRHDDIIKWDHDIIRHHG